MRGQRMNHSTLKRLGVYTSLVAVASLSTLLAVRARAEGIPEADVLTYTGYLENGDGQPLTKKLAGIGVEVWDAAEDGKRVCDTSVENVTPQAGRFQIVLPAECTDAVKTTPNLWIDVKVEGASLGRTKLGGVPYAIEAGHATTADSSTIAESANGAAGPLKTKLDGLSTSVDELLDKDTKHLAGVNAVAGDLNYAECNANRGNAQICGVMAHEKCKKSGFATGFYQGGIDTGVLGIICLN